MIDEILELGFDAVELSHGLQLTLLPGIKKAVEDKRARIEGVHNFFPAPIESLGDSPDMYQFTSYKEPERKRALELTFQTMEHAAELGASYVVLHMGSVPFFKANECTRELERMARNGLIGTREYALRKGEIVRRRMELGPRYCERARDTLAALADKAAASNLKLGIEGRSHLEQVPDEPEMLQLMQEFADHPHIGYWHDFGHIQRKHNLLLLNHDQFLQSMQPYLIGSHVNDVRWPSRDHRAPFKGGDVDFAALLRYFKPEMPLSWELSSSMTVDDIRTARQKWDACLPW